MPHFSNITYVISTRRTIQLSFTDKGVQASLPIKVSLGARLSVALDGANLTFAIDPGNSDSNWKLQRSSNLLFWEDVQTLNAQNLEGLKMPVGNGSAFYRVVEQ